MINLISIVLPVHNEFLNLGKLIKEWDIELKKITNIQYEFVIVEDGSSDGTKELIIELEKTFHINNLSSEKKEAIVKQYWMELKLQKEIIYCALIVIIKLR